MVEKFQYFSDCVSWPYNAIDLLNDLTENSIEITRETFLKHVNREQLKDLELSLGYVAHHNQGMTMNSDYAVTYHRGRTQFKQVTYYFKHSAIEYVFTKNGVLQVK